MTQDPDITLHELRAALEAAEGVRVHHSAIDQALTQLGYTFKKKSLVAEERRKSRARRARANCQAITLSLQSVQVWQI